MRTLTTPAPVDEQALEQLELEFLRLPAAWPSSPELDLADLLSPAIGPIGDDPACRGSKIKSKYGGCCA